MSRYNPFVFVCLLQVTGVVGRAETLSSVFYLSSYLFYAEAAKRKKYSGNYVDIFRYNHFRRFAQYI